MIIMKKFIPNADVEYFWEYEYGFGMDFLKSLFQENYKRIYSKGGDGICDLVLYNNKIYDISFTASASSTTARIPFIASLPAQIL